MAQGIYQTIGATDDWFEDHTEVEQEHDEYIVFQFGFFKLTVVKLEAWKAEICTLPDLGFQIIEPDIKILSISGNNQCIDGTQAIFRIEKADISDLSTNDFFSMRKVPKYVLAYAAAVIISQVSVLILILRYKSKSNDSCLEPNTLDMVVVRLFIAFYLSVQIVGSMSNIYTHSLTKVVDILVPKPPPVEKETERNGDIELAVKDASAESSFIQRTTSRTAKLGSAAIEQERLIPKPTNRNRDGRRSRPNWCKRCCSGVCIWIRAIPHGLAWNWNHRNTITSAFWAPILAPFWSNHINASICLCVGAEWVLIVSLAVATAVITKQENDILGSAVNFAGILLVFDLDNLAMRAINFRPTILTFDTNLVTLDRTDADRNLKLRDEITYVLSIYCFAFIASYLFFPLHVFMVGALVVVILQFLAGCCLLKKEAEYLLLALLCILVLGWFCVRTSQLPTDTCIIPLKIITSW